MDLSQSISEYLAAPYPVRHLMTPTPSRIAETLPSDILAKMHAPPKPDYPLITPNEIPQFDGFIFGSPTRYGNFPAQWKVSARYSPRTVWFL